MRKKTKRRLLILLALGLAFIVAAGGAYAYRKHRIAKGYEQDRAAGLAAYERKDYAAAVNRLGRYIRRFQDDVDVLRAYAYSVLELPKQGPNEINSARTAL
ncbi:MAG: hypothetical protein ABFS86_21145, partial [Planctomycetota bacterium]